ncbi:MAG: mucoidy inhibitor MuiA family protein [Flavobacteriia bacterium]|nr:mucoidy inhibitor MuiA family protein [Flavobacteriia bacterium]
MKINFLFTFILLGYSLFANEPVNVKSSLTGVTVYMQGAQLQHKANYSIKAGISEVIVEGISPQISASTIQVKATGAVVILDSKYEFYYPQPATNTNTGELPPKIRAAIKALEDSLRLVNFELRDINDEIEVLVAARKIIISNGAVKGQGKVNDSIQLLKSTVDYYTTKVSELNKKISSLDRQKVKKADLIASLDTRLNDLRNYAEQNNPTPEIKGIPRIVITLMAKEAATGRIDLTYFASNAGWTPLYDIRSEAASGKISLTYKAQVRQQTGLDWNDVKLSISTNNPYANKTKPELNPWYIDYQVYRKELEEKAKMRSDAYNNAPSVNSQMMNMGFAYTQRSSMNDEIAQTPEAFTTVVQQLIAAEFKIDLNYSIASDNQVRMVLVKQSELNTSFRYYAVPKLDPGVYLVAQMTKLDELQLVPAKANIFFDGTYIGETYIDPTTMDDTLNLSLGKDPNIIVKRTLLKDQSKERIIQDKKERNFAYSIEVRNLKSSEIDLIIQDQVPLTTNPEITIEKSIIGKGTLDEKTGLVEWKLKLKAKENQTFDYEFKVRHPKDKVVQI